MKHKYTHYGYVVGCDAREKILLRETKLYWITPKGQKFRKKWLSAVNSWNRLQDEPRRLKKEKNDR